MSSHRQKGTIHSTGRTSVIAHRGFAGIYPENTVSAVRQATVEGPSGTPDAVEIDVMPSADGEVVVFHDAHLGRVTDAPPRLRDRNVWEITWETLREVSVLSTGETVPRLSTLLEYVPSDVAVNVELKNPGTADIRPGRKLTGEALEAARERWIGFVDRVLDITAEFPHDLLLSSFCEGALAAARELDPSVPVASVFSESIEAGWEITREYDCEALHVPHATVTEATTDRDDAERGTVEADDLVRCAHDEGRAVNAWTVTTWKQATELRAAGVDGIIADYPGLLRYDPAKGTPNSDART